MRLVREEDLNIGTQIVCTFDSRDDIVGEVWTCTDVHPMNYIGHYAWSFSRGGKKSKTRRLTHLELIGSRNDTYEALCGVYCVQFSLLSSLTDEDIFALKISGGEWQDVSEFLHGLG